ncbi:MAG: RIP metalloprotease RseP [Bacteroidota bacterium]
MDYIPFLTMLGKFILGLSLIVGIHELGHLFFAKVFAMRVEEYMIFLPPKLFSFKWGETEYGVGSIPLGGFVKIAGMVDGAMDEAQVNGPAEGWEFRSKSRLKQLLVMLGGIIFNLMSAFFIYACIFYLAGRPYIAKQTFNGHGIEPTQLGLTVGLKWGDRVISKNGLDFRSFEELQTGLGKELSYVVLRGGKEVVINVNEVVLDDMKLQNQSLMRPLLPFVIGEVKARGLGDQAGLKKGDRILFVNDMPTPYVQDLSRILDSYEGGTLKVTCERNGRVFTKEIPFGNQDVLGIGLESTLEKSWQSYSLSQACMTSILNIGQIIKLQAKGLALMATGKISPFKSIAGPVQIMKVFGMSSGYYSFWALLALLSVIIAFMNLLPIPTLDGGRVAIIICEMLMGGSLSNSWRFRLERLGMLILLLLMLFGLFNDFFG